MPRTTMGAFDEVLQHREVREQVEVLEHHAGLGGRCGALRPR